MSVYIILLFDAAAAEAVVGELEGVGLIVGEYLVAAEAEAPQGAVSSIIVAPECAVW